MPKGYNLIKLVTQFFPPLIYILNDGRYGIFPYAPLLTKDQAEELAKEGNWVPVQTEGDYVGCRDCKYQKNWEVNGCGEHGITSDNCLRVTGINPRSKERG